MSQAMTFTATSSNLPPFGLYVGKLTDIKDMGIQSGQFGDQHQVRFVIQVTEILDSQDEELAEDYIGNEVWAYANVSFGPRAKLRKWCQAIAGRQIEDGEQFNADEIIGKSVRFTISENTVGNPTVSDLAGYRKAKPKAAKKTAPVEDEVEDDEGEEVEDF